MDDAKIKSLALAIEHCRKYAQYSPEDVVIVAEKFYAYLQAGEKPVVELKKRRGRPPKQPVNG